MKLNIQLTKAVIGSFLSLIVFSYLAFLVEGQAFVEFDRVIISYVQGLETAVLTQLMELFTFIGSAPFVLFLSLIIIVLFYKILHHRQELILFIFVIAGSVLLNYLLKLFFQRARPDLNRLIEISGYSFPSGHAMNAFTFYGMLAFLLWRHLPIKFWRGILIVCSSSMIFAIGISRVYLGVHYPSDILAGYVASAFWLSFAIYFFESFEKRKSRYIQPAK